MPDSLASRPAATLCVASRLHDAMVDWLFAQGLSRLSLVTESGTRAERFYRRAGWQCLGPASNIELEFALAAGDWRARP